MLQLYTSFKSTYNECEVYENDMRLTEFNMDNFFNPHNRYELVLRVLIEPYENKADIRFLVTRLKIDTSA